MITVNKIQKGESGMSIEERIRSSRKLDNVQLKQKIIHLQAELARYKQIVTKYQNNYHYNQFDELTNEIEVLRVNLVEKEADILQLKEQKTELEAQVELLRVENTQFGDKYVQLEEQLNQLRIENSLLTDENELIKLENSSLQKTLDHQEEEVMKLREKVELAERENNIFKPKKANTQIKKEADPTDSWFLRTLKQQSKDEET
ncbi:hypothetical protein H1D32_23340 [Anaerobacillus sp. CMMVII]|uniref:hypothetical protein n=1 Tax=Anaerobacillus sp. CMMVII TaxID=2755588 RepID=UPI0021B7D1B5|nr:hypothetical protein [Anaerobacillus sp. CMMVII]MCT8140372.1 hypothetical protein [Anaerobacillus sp. CMMVII]